MDDGSGDREKWSVIIQRLRQVRGNRHLWRLLQVIFTVLPLWFVFQNLQHNWQRLANYEWRVDASNLMLSLVFIVLAFALLPLAGQQALVGAGVRISFRKTYWAYYIAQLSKYLPGGIWVFPGRALALQRYNVSVVSSTVAMFVELSMLVLSGVIIFLPYVVIVGTQPTSASWWWPIVIILPLAIILHPAVQSSINRRLFRFVPQSDVSSHWTLRRGATILCLDIMFWLLTGAAFSRLVASLEPTASTSWLSLTAAFSMAWVIGFLAFLSPAGLGIREGALALLLAPLLPAPLPALVAVVARLWWTLAESISVGIAHLVGGSGARAASKGAQ